MNDSAFSVTYDESRVRQRKVDERIGHASIVEHIGCRLSAQDLVERRLRDEDLPLPHELWHLSEQKGQQQRADVRAVDIGVGHDDDAAVAEFRDVKIFSDSALQRLNEDANFFEAENLIQACLLNIEQLSTQWQDRLVDMVAATLGRSTCGITLDDKELGLLDII